MSKKNSSDTIGNRTRDLPPLIYFQFLIHDFLTLLVLLSLSTSGFSRDFFVQVFRLNFYTFLYSPTRVLSFLHYRSTRNRESLSSDIPFLLKVVFVKEI